MDKNAARKIYLSKRNRLSLAEIERKSTLIHEKLFETIFYKEASTIFTYVSFGSEVLTTPIITMALKSGKKVAVPVTVSSGRKMFFIQIFGIESLHKNKFGVPEPEFNTNCILQGDMNTINLIPGVAFDRQKNRIGYGAGYYDRYLSENKFRKNIALSFTEQITDNFQGEIHDIVMDLVITEGDIYV